jgi:membrane protein required for colicin V production
MDMFDIIVLAVIGILTVFGLLNGMVKQLFGLAGVVAGYMLAMRYYQLCSKYLTSLHPGTAKVISFIAIFLVCIVVAHIIGWLVGKFVTTTGLGFLNRIGGGLLGFAKGCLIVCVVVTVLHTFLPADNQLLEKSRTIRYILPVTVLFKKVTHADIKAKYNEKVGKEKAVEPKKKTRSDSAQ